MQAFDMTGLFWLCSFHSDAAEQAARAISTLAWKGWLWWLVIGACWLKGRRDISLHLGLGLIIATLAGLPLKGLLARPRPDLYASQQLNIPMPELMSTAHSFPSGHTLLAATFAFIIWHYYKDYRGWLALAFVALVGLARVYGRYHWPTDIMGSILLGALAAWAAGKLLKLPQLQRFVKPAPKAQAALATEQEPVAGRR
jgi:membrane-associated phospholipid phosphatase